MIIKGRLTDDGRIEAELPEGWQPGEVSIEIAVDADTVWTEEELEELAQYMKFEGGKTLGEIPSELIGAGADWDIGDSAEWVEEQRRKRREERRKRWTDST
jgi:hypothetical protein